MSAGQDRASARPGAPQAPRSSRLTPACPGDEGFSLMEVLIALTIISTVMLAATPFMVKSVVVVGKQRSMQSAVQVANDAVERVRAIKPASLVQGRSELETRQQSDLAKAGKTPDDKPTKLALELATMVEAWDSAASPPLGVRAPLPTVPVSVSLSGQSYDQQWFVGRCWQSKSAGGSAQDCAKTANAGDAEYIRVVVSVTWTANSCNDTAANQCMYVASTLASIGADPVFSLNTPPPTILGPSTAFAYVDEEVDGNDELNLQMLSKGGAPGMLTWSADPAKMPPGLAIVPESGAFTGVPTATGTYPIPVKVTDSADESDTFTLTLTVYPQLAVAFPGDQTSQVGDTVNRAVLAAGGRTTYAWEALDLPAGLTINPATGVITGTVTTASAQSVTVTVTDANGRTESTSFVWIVGTPPPGTALTANRKNPMTVNLNASVNITMTALGGKTPYAWTAQDLPPGLSINSSTGAVTGRPTSCTRYVSTMTVTDSAGKKSSTEVVWLMKRCGGARVTSPSPSMPDQTTVLGAVVNLTAKTDMALSSSPRWTATGLPPGLSMTVSGTVTGSPTRRDTYPVRFTVTNGSKTSVLMFTWTVK
ncbi:putative Ig domain-containing protein [Actinoplanes sp. NPDC049668]|uniref:putative Ig domain-containing protein n=1 Tax=unclassified Actinoplanes TaxID=2626549 RepID=UPI0033B566D5